MSCIRCSGVIVKERSYDRVDDQGVLRLGAWRWATWCRECGQLVDGREVTASQTSNDLAHPGSAAPNRMISSAPVRRFMMF